MAEFSTVLATHFASQAEAEAGSNNTKVMTPLRAAQAIAELAGGANAYDVSGGCVGAPEASAKIGIFNAVRAFTLPASLTDSEATAEVAADAETIFSVKKNGSEIGTITFAAAGTSGTFAGAGASFAAGDKLTVVAPASPDADLADVAFTLKGTVG